MSKFRGPLLNSIPVGGTREWMQNLPIGQEPDYCVYFNDFLENNDFLTTDWVITTTEAGAGDASEALAADEACGALLITNDAADNDADHLQMTEENWRLTAGKKLWFETRIKVSDADQCDMFIGLGITDTTPLVTSDRVGFQIDDGSATIRALCEKDATETTGTAGTAADATYVKLGFYYDGAGSVKFFVDRSLVVTHTTNIPDDENLCVSFCIVNGEAVAKTLTVDYIYVAQER